MATTDDAERTVEPSADLTLASMVGEDGTVMVYVVEVDCDAHQVAVGAPIDASSISEEHAGENDEITEMHDEDGEKGAYLKP